MKTYIVVLALAAISCSSNQQKAKQNERVSINDKCFVYPRAVDSLQVKDLYDSARWYVYTTHCDEAYLPKRDTSKSVTFGELPLKFNNVSIKGDTIEINFDFIDEDEPYPILPSMTRDNIQFLSGVGFDIKNRKRIYMLSPNGFSQIEKGPSTRYENPLQPEVIAYIKSNWEKLNSCFKELAERKGITK
jgi:hypothetical protein